MKKIIIVGFLIMLGSCSDDSPVNENLNQVTIEHARKWFDENMKVASNKNGRASSILDNVLWDEGIIYEKDDRATVEVPMENRSGLIAYPKGISENPNYRNLTKLLLLSDNKGGYDVFVMRIMPDTSSITDLDQNTYSEKTNSFTGDIIYYTWQGTPLVYARYENGERKERGYVEQTSKKTGARINECYVTEVRWYSVACSAGSCGDPVYLYSDFYYFCSGPGSNPNDAEDPGDLYGGGGGNGSGGYTPTVDDWEATINDTQLKPCMQTIVADLKNISQGSVGQIIQRFSGNTPGYNWALKDGTLSGSTNASTSIVFNTSSGTVTTTFDAGKMKNSSDLSIARTILHESIHSYVVAVTFNTLTDPVQKAQLLGPDWLNAALNYGHDFITNNYLIPIADALEFYGQSKGYNLSRQFYEDLSWGGLTHYQNPPNNETALFLQKVPNTTDRNRILNTISIELTGKDVYGNSATKSGSNAGC